MDREREGSGLVLILEVGAVGYYDCPDSVCCCKIGKGPVGGREKRENGEGGMEARGVCVASSFMRPSLCY